MPLIRYFVFVGGVLFVLLLAASHSGVKKEPPAQARGRSSASEAGHEAGENLGRPTARARAARLLCRRMVVTWTIRVAYKRRGAPVRDAT